MVGDHAEATGDLEGAEKSFGELVGASASYGLLKIRLELKENLVAQRKGDVLAVFVSVLFHPVLGLLKVVTKLREDTLAVLEFDVGSISNRGGG